MSLKRFKIICTLRVILLSASIFLFFYLLFKSTSLLYATILILGGLIVYQIFSLIRYVDQTNRELARFLQSVRHADFSQTFSSGSLGSSFKELSSSFTNVMDDFRQARSEKVEHFQYLQTVVQHIGIGVISFQSDGQVELINKAAKKLLNVEDLKNIRSLEKFSQPVVESILGLESGKSTLVKTQTKDGLLQLAIRATEFKLHGKLFTLISLQDIQSEVERERLAKELEIAQEVQRKLLPTNGVQFPGYDIAGLCIPAREIGGDYYDFIRLGENKFGIVIGDVSGKGVPAAIYMTLTKGIIQAFVEEKASPADVLSKVNGLMYRTIERGSFVSMIFAVIDLSRRKMIYARAGHNPAIHYHSASGTATMLQTDGIALGLENGKKFRTVIREEEVSLELDDTVVFYTDGITEAMDENQEEFGEEQLLEAITGNRNKDAKGLIQAIDNRIREFVGKSTQHDDMTMVALKIGMQ